MVFVARLLPMTAAVLPFPRVDRATDKCDTGCVICTCTLTISHEGITLITKSAYLLPTEIASSDSDPLHCTSHSLIGFFSTAGSGGDTIIYSAVMFFLCANTLFLLLLSTIHVKFRPQAVRLIWRPVSMKSPKVMDMSW